MLQSEDFGKVYNEMHLKKMYKEVFMMIDTCQAMTLFDQVDSPDLILMGTSVLGQSALSHQHDFSMNMDLNDKFTFYMNEFLEGNMPEKFTEKTTLSEFSSIFNHEIIKSDITFKNTHSTRKLEDIHLQEYLPLPNAKVDQGLKYFNIEELDV